MSSGSPRSSSRPVEFKYGRQSEPEQEYEPAPPAEYQPGPPGPIPVFTGDDPAAPALASDSFLSQLAQLVNASSSLLPPPGAARASSPRSASQVPATLPTFEAKDPLEQDIKSILADPKRVADPLVRALAQRFKVCEYHRIETKRAYNRLDAQRREELKFLNTRIAEYKEEAKAYQNAITDLRIRLSADVQAAKLKEAQDAIADLTRRLESGGGGTGTGSRRPTPYSRPAAMATSASTSSRGATQTFTFPGSDDPAELARRSARGSSSPRRSARGSREPSPSRRDIAPSAGGGGGGGGGGSALMLRTSSSKQY